MKNPAPVNLQTQDEVRAAGWQAESRDGDGHLIRVHAAFSSDDQMLEMIREAFEHGETVSLWPSAPDIIRAPASNAALIGHNRKMIGRWKEIVEDGPEGNEPLGTVVRALEKTTDALASVRRSVAETVEVAGDIRAALEGLLVQALQSNVNSPSNEWGREALAKARKALGGKWTETLDEDDAHAR